MKEIFAVASGVLFLAGYVPYIRGTLQGKIAPSKASWITWAILDALTVSGMHSKHALNAQIVGALAGSSAVAFLSLKYGAWGWTRLDKICLGAAGIGIVLWLALRDPIFGILVFTGANIPGSIPTFRSAWNDPAKEASPAWMIWWVSCLLAVATIPAWTLAHAAQPLTFFALNCVMVLLVHVRPLMKREHLSSSR